MTTKYVSLEAVNEILMSSYASEKINSLPTLEIDKLQRYENEKMFWMHESDDWEYIRYDDLKKLLLQ